MFNVELDTSVPGLHVSRKQGLPGFNVGSGNAMGRGPSGASDLPDHALNPYVPWLRLPTGRDDHGYPPADMNAYALRSTPDFPAATYQPASYYPNSLPWYWLPAFPNVQTADNCPEIIENCRQQCTDRYSAGTLRGARGPDAPLVLRRCIRDCVAPSGCSY
jgi:hypothetical protein